MELTRIYEVIEAALRLIGVAILALGGLVSAVWFVVEQVRHYFFHGPRQLNDIRRFLIERIILSLDFFIAADLLKTIIELTFEDLGLLAGIIIIRAGLTYLLERELGEELPEE